MRGSRYVFDEFVLDLDRACLTRRGEDVRLRPKAFDALKYLVEHPGRVVTKDELIGAIWPAVVVTDDSLAKCIQEIREALGDRPPRYVKTVPRRGYLFDGPVETQVAAATEHDDSAAAAGMTKGADEDEPALTPPTARGWAALAVAAFAMLGILGASFYVLRGDEAERSAADAPLQGDPSIAVLPFLNLSSDEEQAYFSDGLAEELLSKLARLNGLRVAARTSSFTFKGSNEDVRVIAARLGVANVLEGSVRKDGDEIRITVQLIEAAGGTHLWSATYERELDDIFAIQQEIAESVAAALSITLGVSDRERLRPGTHDIEAFDEYLAGQALLNELGADATARGIAHVRRATEIDPGYADAWSVLALAYLQNAYFVTGEFAEAERQSERAARRALELDPNMSAAHAALAHVHTQRGEWLRAEQAALRAVSIPSDFVPTLDYAEILEAAGYLDEHLDYRRQARRDLPLHMAYSLELALAYHELGDDESAEIELARAESLIGDRFRLVDTRLTLALAGRDEDALRRLLADEVNAEDPFVPVLVSMLDAPETAPGALRGLRAALERHHPGRAVGLATWAAYFDEPELAMQILSPSAHRASLYVQAAWYPVMRDARRTETFKELARDLGLVDYWRVRGWPTRCRPLGSDDFECY